MQSVTVSVDIAAPLWEVWTAAADLAGHVRWMADVESIEFGSEARQGAGTEMRVATRVGPFRTTDVMTITDWEPPRRISVLHHGFFTGRGEFDISAVGGATRFTWSEEIDFPWRVGGPIAAIFARPVLSLIWRRNLLRFKALFDG
jgi:carbon monoxide dehydrogenase subunit G